MKSTAAEIIEIGRRLWQRGYVAANDGNISVWISEEEILTTATGVSKGFLTEDDIIAVDIDGKPINSAMKPSSELPMHLEIYKRRPDVKAIVHAHPPTATGFACAGVEMDRAILPEVILTLGHVLLTPYGTTGTDELASIIGEGIKNHNGLLMQNHGAVTIGDTVSQAYYRMETLEHFAEITLVTRILGRQSVLSESELVKLAAKGGTKIETGDSLSNEKRSGNIAEKIEISREDLVELIYRIINRN